MYSWAIRELHTNQNRRFHERFAHKTFSLDVWSMMKRIAGLLFAF